MCRSILQCFEQNDEKNYPPNPPHSQPPFLVVCARPHTVENRTPYSTVHLRGTCVPPEQSRERRFRPLGTAPIRRADCFTRNFIISDRGREFNTPDGPIYCAQTSLVSRIWYLKTRVYHSPLRHTTKFFVPVTQLRKQKRRAWISPPKKRIGVDYGSTLTQPPLENTTRTYQTGTRSHQSHQNILLSPLSLETVSRP